MNPQNYGVVVWESWVAIQNQLTDSRLMWAE